MKRVLIIRYGAWGDMIIATPILPFLKRDGWHITVNCNKRGAQVIKHNPYVDKVLTHDETIPNEELDSHWESLSKNYDRVINLSESIEKGLLAVEGSEEFKWPHEERHMLFDKNYYDKTLELAGYGYIKGLNGELYFSAIEESLFRDERTKNLGKFVILWSLSGSSHHKAWPYAEIAAIAFLEKHPDAVIYTVGDDLCMMLEWDHPRTFKRSGLWPIRKTFLMAKYADLVISGESAIANAAGCFDTPKIILLSHSSEENLSKYWQNCVSVNADVPCHPCHQIHYTEESCPTGGEIIKGPVCMTELMPDKLFQAMDKNYEQWRKDGDNIRQREQRISA